MAFYDIKTTYTKRIYFCQSIRMAASSGTECQVEWAVGRMSLQFLSEIVKIDGQVCYFIVSRDDTRWPAEGDNVLADGRLDKLLDKLSSNSTTRAQNYRTIHLCKTK